MTTAKPLSASATPLAQSAIDSSADQDILITRIFDAPRELVFKAWTDPYHLARWHAPTGCAIQFRKLEIRTGGSFHSCIRTPDGHNCWCTGIYHEVTPPQRLVYTLAISDEQGRALSATQAGMDPAWPRETTVTVTFADVGGKTKLTLHQTVSEMLAKRTGAHPSWLSMLDHLNRELLTLRKESQRPATAAKA